MSTMCTDSRISAALPDLASIREQKGISLRQIADATKICLRYLQAIEESQFDMLPGGVFTTSYIRQYARAIDYDEWDLLARYDACTNADSALVQQEEEAPRRGLLNVLHIAEPVMRWLSADKKA